MLKYGATERYNILRFANKIECPAHFIFGEKELSEPTGAFDEILPKLQTLDWSGKEAQFTLIPKANHFYVGTMDKLIEEITQSFNKIS